MRRLDVGIETKSSSISSSINSSWPVFIQTKFSDEVFVRRIQTKSSSLYKYGHLHSDRNFCRIKMVDPHFKARLLFYKM